MWHLYRSVFGEIYPFSLSWRRSRLWLCPPVYPPARLPLTTSLLWRMQFNYVITCVASMAASHSLRVGFSFMNVISLKWIYRTSEASSSTHFIKIYACVNIDYSSFYVNFFSYSYQICGRCSIFDENKDFFHSMVCFSIVFYANHAYFHPPHEVCDVYSLELH